MSTNTEPNTVEMCVEGQPFTIDFFEYWARRALALSEDLRVRIHHVERTAVIGIRHTTKYVHFLESRVRELEKEAKEVTNG